MKNIWSWWGKTHSEDSSEPKTTHPPPCHMIDVAEVTGAMWSECLGEGMHQALCQHWELDEQDCRATLMFWAALHDLGKARPAFQRRHEPAIRLPQAQGLSFSLGIGREPCYHGTVTAWALRPLLKDLQGLRSRAARGIASAVGGHHGSWPTANALLNLGPSQRGDVARRHQSPQPRSCPEPIDLEPIVLPGFSSRIRFPGEDATAGIAASFEGHCPSQSTPFGVDWLPSTAFRSRCLAPC